MTGLQWYALKIKLVTIQKNEFIIIIIKNVKEYVLICKLVRCVTLKGAQVQKLFVSTAKLNDRCFCYFTAAMASP